MSTQTRAAHNVVVYLYMNMQCEHDTESYTVQAERIEYEYSNDSINEHIAARTRIRHVRRHRTAYTYTRTP